jgi:hypothetical protein
MAQTFHRRETAVPTAPHIFWHKGEPESHPQKSGFSLKEHCSRT